MAVTPTASANATGRSVAASIKPLRASATSSPRAGLRQALFLTRLTQRLLIPGLSQLTDPSPPAPSRLRAAARAYEASLDDLARQAGLCLPDRASRCQQK
jgi:hypothetical protein